MMLCDFLKLLNDLKNQVNTSLKYQCTFEETDAVRKFTVITNQGHHSNGINQTR